jgi:hypothetical protein
MATKPPPNPSRLRLPRPLYGPSHPKGPTHGPDVISVKRATSRAFPDVFPWAEFDQVYNGRLEKAWRQIQGDVHIEPHSGQYGKLSHELLRGMKRNGHPNEWAFDATAINLMQAKWEAIHEPPDSPEDRVKAAMVDFMRKSLAAASLWHYSWTRPMRALGRDPRLKQSSDCSTGATEVLFWARMVTGVLIPDPNGRGWDGWGNTDTLWAANSGRRVTGTYEVGDMALFWAHLGHVIVCLEPGSSQSALWWSNGSESAPTTTRLNYRSDLRGVVRPRLTT